MGLSKSSILLVGAIAAVGFGAGASMVMLNVPERIAVWNAPQEPSLDTSGTSFSLTDQAAAASSETAGQSAQVLAALQSLENARQSEEVSRGQTDDLLQVAPQVQPEPTASRQVAVADQAASAAFFKESQAKLAAQDTCGDDLRALAANTRIYFPRSGLSGTSQGLAAARLIGQVARDCPGFTIQVEGHSDPSGDPVINQRLSEERAASVISRLASGGIDTSNMIAKGYGDTRPSGVTGPEGDAFYDRRVEFSIVENLQQASLGTATQTWQNTSQPASSCVQALERQASASRVFFAPRAITANPTDMETAQNLAGLAARCDGVRLRLVGHYSDQPGSRESATTARLRALAMMSALAAGGADSQRILIGSSSESIGIPGQPGLPKGRIEFQIITD